MERWRMIKGSTKYEISDRGKIRRVLKNGKTKPIRTYLKANKWMVAKVDYKGVYREHCVHTLVASAFLPPKPAGHVVYHKNGCITDNDFMNLGWITRKELGRKSGARSDKSIAVIQLDRQTGEIIDFFPTIREAGRKCYISHEAIRCAVIGKQKTAGGFKWKKETFEDWD